MIVQTLRALKSVGVKKVEIVRSPNDEVIKEVVGAAKLSLKVNFHTQKEPLGTGDALLTAKGVLEERFLMVSGQQVNVADHLNLLSGKENGVVLFSQKTDEPQKYGMLALNGNRVTRAVEKPKDARGLSDQRIMGIYVFTRDFIDFMATFKITDYLLVEALDAYTKENEVVAVETPYPAISLKYAWDLTGSACFPLSRKSKRAQR
ncbi:MAG: Bifunctional protein GlmU [Candidatus Woesebacteria bacterium GW2011_GWE1_45_18]|uniref:Bifunctional protein GlmU n=1 Tax=Candidatus Woesebacteria bacterium GW2011_GWE1_45_18 TaxID=1618598 RepID=A0A0G1M6K9_9BACT|nr:MAG: Bifunctional protein GlmU [Candidatus Woesebacteria bacterium GW2011_GWE1_45_18]